MISDPVERVESPESFLGVLLVLVGDRLVQDIFLVAHVVASHRQLSFELGAFCRARLGTEHARRKAFETARHIQCVENGQTGRTLELFQLHHARAAIEAHAYAFVTNTSGVAGRTGQPDPVGFVAAGCRVGDTGQPRETDRQAIEILDRRRSQS